MFRSYLAKRRRIRETIARCHFNTGSHAADKVLARQTIWIEDGAGVQIARSNRSGPMGMSAVTVTRTRPKKGR